MKRLTILTFILSSVSILMAQENISVSVRADNNQPFTATISGKQINSSLSGLLQIPDLKNGVHEITVSFPENRFPDQQLRLSVSRTDTMFYLKRAGDQNWTIQSANSSQSSSGSSTSAGDGYGKRKSDPFAVLMAAVVNDSSVLYTSAVKSEPVRKTESPQVVTKSTAQQAIKSSATENDTITKTNGIKTSDSSIASVDNKKKDNALRELPPIVDANTTMVKPDSRNGESAKTKDLSKPVITDSVAKKTVDAIASAVPAKTEENKEVLEVKKTVPDSSTKALAQKDSKVSDSTAAMGVANDKKMIDSGVKSTTNTNRETTKDSIINTVASKPAASNKPTEDKNLPAPVETASRPVEKKESVKSEAVKPPVLDNNTRIFQLGVVKAAEKKDEQAVHLIYIDRASPDKADTIMISIPLEPAGEYKPSEPLFRPSEGARQEDSKNSNPPKKVAEKKSANSSRKKTIDSANAEKKADNNAAVRDTAMSASAGVANKNSKPPSEPLFRPIQRPVDSTLKADSSKKEYTAGSAWRPLEKKTTAMVNSDCQAFATEYDLDRLRVKMLADNNADDRIATARKVFRTKCFTTKQIRALSELFSNDEGKYKFLDAAYPFVSDSDSFKQLAELLKDQYYLNRFNAMLRN